MGEEAEHFQNQFDMENWPAMKERMSEIIKRKTRDQWDEVFDGVDVYYAPVLAMSEVRNHPHHQARESFLEDEDGIWQPAPAPRFSRTKAQLSGAAAALGEHSTEILQEFGFSEAEIAANYAAGAVTDHNSE